MGNKKSVVVMQKRLSEFEKKEGVKELVTSKERFTVQMQENNIGDYYNNEISNEKYYYFEDRFKELVGLKLVKYRKRVKLGSKEEFVGSMFKDDKLRKELIKIIRRKGVMHAYRWETWYLLATSDNSFNYDEKREKDRYVLYKKLLQQSNKEVEDIVNKDVLRTSRHKNLFKEIDSLGTLKLYNVCKAVGLFFPKSGYVQGMNFIAAFILEINGIDEFKCFDWIVSFWKKKKNMFNGIYEPGFPLLQFMLFAFDRFLYKKDKKLAKLIDDLGFPPEMWLTKWIISFFTFSVNKEFLLRIFDFIMINDVMGPVYCALAIALQLKPLFKTKNFAKIASTLGNSDKLSAKLDFRKFVKTLKVLKHDGKKKLKILYAYNSTLTDQRKEAFLPFFESLESQWKYIEIKEYNNFNFNEDSHDFDNLTLEGYYAETEKDEESVKEETKKEGNGLLEPEAKENLIVKSHKIDIDNGHDPIKFYTNY